MRVDNAEVIATMTTVSNGLEGQSFRRMFRKWRDRLKSSTCTPHPRNATPTAGHRGTSPPAALFLPTTQTTISSPSSPFQPRSVSNSESPSPPSTMRIRQRPTHTRRNTESSTYLLHDNASDSFVTLNKITTTITATAPRKPRLKHRLSLTNRSSSFQAMAPSVRQGSFSKATTSQNASIGNMKGRREEEKENLVEFETTQVIRRDGPKKTLDGT